MPDPNDLLRRAEELSEAAKLAERCGDAVSARRLRRMCVWVYRNAVEASVGEAKEA